MTEEGGPGPGGERPGRTGVPLALAMGASAGGPRALLRLLAALEIPSSVYAFLVQHIHPKFTALLVRRLAEVTAIPVQQAEDGARVQPGRFYLAPGGRHLVVERARPGLWCTRLTEDPPEHGVRPSVDRLFTSVAAAFGPRVVGVVLTGMGRDGLDGARSIKAHGGVVLAEAETTCAVYGMPRALAEAGLADHLVPLDGMAEAIRQAFLTAAGLPSPAGLAPSQ